MTILNRLRLTRNTSSLKWIAQGRGTGHEPKPGWSAKERDERSDEVLFYCIARGSAAGIDPQLIEDGSHMRVDRRQAHHQLFGDLGIGQSFGQ